MDLAPSQTLHLMFMFQTGNIPQSFLDFPHAGTFKVIVECPLVWVWYFLVIRFRLYISGWNNLKNDAVIFSSTSYKIEDNFYLFHYV